jgi:hypothetical protein
MLGEVAIFLTGKHLQVSPRVLEDSAINFLSGDVACIEKKVHIPDLTSRIVKDIKVSYEFKKIDGRTKTNLGKVSASKMPEVLGMFIDITDDREGDLYVGSPVTIYYHDTIMNADKTNLSSLNLKKTTPFMNLDRKVSVQKGKVVVEHKLELLRGYILNEELKTEEYRKLRECLKKEFSIGVITK